MSQYIYLFRNFSSNSISTFFPVVKQKGFVGRWSIPNKNTDTVINQILDRNNEDHCGVCMNTDENLMKKNIVDVHDDDDYLRPYFM
jgi:hypothetical protein